MGSLGYADYTITAVYSIVFISLYISFGLVCYYKPFYPLRNHSLKLHAIRLFSTSLYLFLGVIWTLRILPCALYSVLLHFGYWLCATVGYIRVSVILNTCRTFFRIKLSQDIGNLKVDSWFIKYRGVFTDQFWFMAVVLHGAVILGLYSIIEAMEDQFLSDTTDPVESCWFLWTAPAYAFLFIYIISLCIILTVFFKRKLKGSADGLYFIEEIKIQLGIWIPVLIIFAGLVLLVNVRLARALLGALAFGSSWHIPLTLAIIRSYRTKKFQFKVRLFEDIAMAVRDFTANNNNSRKASTDSNTSGTSTTALVLLEEVLQNPQKKEKFKTFLIGEWSVETLFFYDDVNSFENSTETEYTTKAMEIFNKFFPSDSIYALHLPGSIVKQVKAKLEDLSLNPNEWLENINIFEEAKAQIIENWIVDAFPRFSKKVLGKKAFSPSSSLSLEETSEVYLTDGNEGN